MFNKPVQNKQCYLSQFCEEIFYDISDINIKNINKLQNNKGYMMSIYLDTKDQQIIKSMDEVAQHALIQNNSTWFNNNLKSEDIMQMFQSSICLQNNTMNAIISQDCKIYVDNKISDINAVSLICKSTYKKEYMVNMKLKYIGMFIYPTHTINKWSVVKMNIYRHEDIDTDDAHDLLEFWKGEVIECKERLNARIKDMEQLKLSLDKKIYEIETIKGNKDFERRIRDLKQSIQNIIF